MQFLEGLNFKQTLLILQQESFDLGYSESSDILFIATSSTADVQTISASKSNQTEFPFVTDEKSFVLESSVCEIPNKQNEAQKPVLVYFTDPNRFYKHSSDERSLNEQKQYQDRKRRSKSVHILSSLRKDKSTNTENNVLHKEARYSKYENNSNDTGNAKLNRSEMVQKDTKVTLDKYQGDVVLNEECFNNEYADLHRNLVTLQDDHEKLMGKSPIACAFRPDIYLKQILLPNCLA